MLKPVLRGTLVGLGSAIALSNPFVLPIQAQPSCPEPEYSPPSKTLRTVELKKFGVKIKIPSNFRTILYNSGVVSVVSPEDFQLAQCVAKGISVPTDVFSPRSFTQHQNPEGLSLQDFRAQQIAPKNTQPAPALSEDTFNNITVVFAESQSGLDLIQGYYQLDGIDGIIEVSGSSKEELKELLQNTQSIAPKQVTTEPQEEAPPQSSQTDPVFVALKERGLNRLGRQLTIVREYMGLNQAIVTMTGEGLKDDSIAGIRSRVTLQKDSNGEWQVTAVQRSQKCQPGRGSQTYGSSLCL